MSLWRDELKPSQATSVALVALYLPSTGTIPPARVLYVSRDAAPSLRTRLRLRETKSGVTTDLPVVREEQLRLSLDIVGVPVVANARTTLRLYAVSDTFDVLDVFIFQQHEGTDDAVALAATRLLVTAPITFGETSFAYPGYAELDLGPLLRNARDSVHVAIVPAYPHYTPNLWAMVSITDNETQRVTIATP